MSAVRAIGWRHLWCFLKCLAPGFIRGFTLRSPKAKEGSRLIGGTKENQPRRARDNGPSRKGRKIKMLVVGGSLFIETTMNIYPP